MAESEAIGSGVVEVGGAVSRRRSRRPSGRHRLCPGTAVAKGDDVAATEVAVVLPASGCAPLWIGLGLGFVGGVYGSGELRPLCRRPPPLFYAQCDGGPPAIVGLGRPRSGRV